MNILINYLFLVNILQRRQNVAKGSRELMEGKYSVCSYRMSQYDKLITGYNKAIFQATKHYFN